MKNIFFKLKNDLKQLFFYPNVNLKEDYNVDYTKYWEKRGRKNSAVLSSWQKQRADIVATMVKPGESIMDVGCGDCALLKYLIEKTGVTGLGVDINTSILENAAKLGIKVYEADLTKVESIKDLPRADYLMGFEILEHMPNPEEFLIKMSPKINKSMFFSFPNTGYYLHRLRLLFGSFPLQWVLHPSEHLRYWTVRDVKFWVTSLGFNLDSLIVYEGVPFFNKILPSIFGQGILIKISKKNDITG